MKLNEFVANYPDEQSCKHAWRMQREALGIVCPKCGHKEYYWKNDKQSWECKSCKRRTSLRSGTLLHKSKLSFRDWFITIHLLSCSGKSFSTMELQRQLGHKHYESIWTMVHKLRSVMEIPHYPAPADSDSDIPENNSFTQLPENGATNIQIDAQHLITAVTTRSTFKASFR